MERRKLGTDISAIRDEFVKALVAALKIYEYTQASYTA